MGENAFAWTLDPIGNRISATKNQEPENYSANQLNQYTQISDGATNFPTYDLDGNMLSYNGWTFTWNGENRLVQSSNSEHVISYAYDYQGRMFQKVVDGVTNSYVWDGWLQVAEVRSQSSEVSTNFYVWGLDLSGTIQGAGGIGGLLSVAVAMPSAPCAMHFPLADGNGNITEYVTINGTIVAHREYSAFGETLALTGTKKDDFTFWFSTKPYDPLTKLSHYQKRDYWAEIGRWGSRDPIGELDGGRDIIDSVDNQADEMNVLAFAENNPIDGIDLFGLTWYFLRNGDATAKAKARSDTIKTLADIVGLDAGAYERWLTVDDGGTMPSSITAVLDCRTFKIPNTIVVWRSAYVSGIYTSEAYMRSLGLKTLVKDFRGSQPLPAPAARALRDLLNTEATAKSLHGLLYGGHGGVRDSDGLSFLTFSGTPQLGEDDTLHYRMAFAAIVGCAADPLRPYILSASPAAKWYATSNRFTYFTAEDLISAGEQGTAK